MKILAFKPNHAEAYNHTGTALQELGHLKQAIAVYNKALALQPDYAEAHRHLSSLKRYKSNDPQIKIVEELLKCSDLKDTNRCHLLYSLAKMNEDLGYFASAYQNYVIGGALILSAFSILV